MTKQEGKNTLAKNLLIQQIQELNEKIRSAKRVPKPHTIEWYDLQDMETLQKIYEEKETELTELSINSKKV